VTIVVGHHHVIPTLDLVPDWWGIQVARMQLDGTIKLSEIREPENNPMLDLRASIQLLWRWEVIQLLGQIGAADGYRSKTRADIDERLLQIAEPDWLKPEIYRQLRARTGWRAGV